MRAERRWRWLDQVRGFLGQIGRQRLIMMAVVAAVMLAVMAVVATRGGDAKMAFLFTDLDPAAAQSIADKLKGQNVPFQLSADGTAVLAPGDKLAELRMSMASDKLGGKIGYDVLDQAEPFGVSASRAKMNETRVIEGELARSIQTLQSVASARVHIVMPERDLFAAQASKATAAVTVRTKGRLSPEAVQSIRYLVSSSVPELSPSAVSIVDQTGALLARAGDEDTNGSGSGDERQQEVENRMRDEIEALLSPIVGQGKVRAKVSADIDRDQTREESDTFDPDKQVIAHQVTVGSKDQSSDSQSATGSSVGNQLPEAQAQAATAGPTRTQARDETSEDTTYDNSKTHSVVLRGPGKIKRLTVAVMVDGGAKGLPAPTIARLTRLVENAVGADSARGDSVMIDSMAFAADDTLKDETPGLLSKLPVDALITFAKLLAIAVVGLIAIMMLRPKAGDGEGDGGARSGDIALAGQAIGPDGQVQLSADGQPLAIGNGGAGGGAGGGGPEISLNQIDGNVKVSILDNVGSTIAVNPNESVAVIREWMNT